MQPTATSIQINDHLVSFENNFAAALESCQLSTDQTTNWLVTLGALADQTELHQVQFWTLLAERKAQVFFLTEDGSQLRDPSLVRIWSQKSGMSLAAAAMVIMRLVWHSDLHQAEIDNIHSRLKNAGLSGRKDELERIAKRVRTRLKDLAGPTLLSDVIPDAPSGLSLPHGWSVEEGDVGLDNPSRGLLEPRLPGIPFINKVAIDEAGRTMGATLVWAQTDGRLQFDVPYKWLVDDTDAKQLTPFVPGLTSLHARTLVKYFGAFLTANKLEIPQTFHCEQQGWFGDPGREGFLLGNELVATPSGNETKLVRFATDDEGKQLVAALTPQGDLQTWVAMVRLLAGCPYAWIVICASFAAALIRLLRAEVFFMHLHGQTSGGKTTALRLGASVWGCPSAKDRPCLLCGWNMTPTSIERRAALNGNLPLFIDDTQQMIDDRLLAKVIYDVTSGRSKGRGTISGLEAQRTWQTIALSTGEAPLAASLPLGGIAARTINIDRPPFGQVCPESAELVRRVQCVTDNHFGHAGPVFLEAVVRQIESLEALQNAAYTRIRDSGSRTDGVSDRLSRHLAILDVAAGIAQKCFDLPVEFARVSDHLMGSMSDAAVEANVAQLAYDLVVSALRYNPPRLHFQIRDVGIAVEPTELNEFLKAHEFRPMQVLSGWKTRGMIDCNHGYRWRTRDQGGVILFRREAIDASQS